MRQRGSTTDDNEDRFGPDVINTVRTNFHVDDVLKSVPNEENATPPPAEQLMKEGGFHLMKFSSNSRKRLATLPEKERANPQLPIARGLGLHWDADSDRFLLKFVH